MYYGLVRKQHLLDMAIVVCDVLGHGNGNAVPMLIETAAAETLLGKYRDTTEYAAGTGITQVDKGTFDWLQGKYANRSVNKRCIEVFNIDLGLVRYDELEHSPLLALIFARLRYRTVPEAIPSTIEGRARYWKKHYNSFHPNAKGTPEKYLTKCAQCDTATLLAGFKPTTEK